MPKGMKEQVREGTLTAQAAIDSLTAQAQEKGPVYVDVLKETKTYRWLAKRATKQEGK
jgi:hypothetical protein